MGVYPSILFGACAGVVAQKSAILLALELKPKTFWCETATNLCRNIKNQKTTSPAKRCFRDFYPLQPD
ncbi:hypothetical protein [Brunnivagina elsteri]|uniref:Uncharacterized protein n=1 Tax=Brunnivagina elsteri CCALA 953 TaxID=987040 RepID=A0A2A2TMK4_9CYAN|nr:hypothetical protein [Calothrix elsteri]PAX59683.1 hypothetical protein CK510_05805 [Calothrix elsteri CCALA 953]